jgi:hypothetical protein
LEDAGACASVSREGECLGHVRNRYPLKLIPFY